MRAYDLTPPERVLLPSVTPLRAPLPGTPEYARAEAETRRREREREVRVAAQLEDALASWRQTRGRHANAVVRIVLDVHQPQAGYDHAVCDECTDSGPGYEAKPTAWPCVTFTVIADTPEDPA